MQKQCPKCGASHLKTGRFCSRSCANSKGPMSEEAKELRRQWAKNNPKGAVADRTKAHVPPKGHRFGANLPKQTIQLVCQECQQTWQTTWQHRARKYCSVVCSNKNKIHANSNRRHRSIYNGYQMDSGAELAFAQLLDQHNIKWEKNSSKSFPFVDSEGKLRLYYPDFYLPDYDHWIEIKGKRYIRKDDHLRLAAVGNIELIMSNAVQLPKCVGDL